MSDQTGKTPFTTSASSRTEIIATEHYDITGTYLNRFGRVPSQKSVKGSFLSSEFKSHMDGKGHKMVRCYEDDEMQYYIYEVGECLVGNHPNHYKDIDAYEDIPEEHHDSLLSTAIDILYDLSSGYPDGLVDELKALSRATSKGGGIKLLCSNQHGMYTKTIRMSDKYTNIDLALQYGSSFPAYHELLLKTIEKDTKGIVLFHGEPGTGKSYYIRYLAATIQGKNIIYVPNSLVPSIGSPGFNTFLLDMVEMDYANGDTSVMSKGIILVIEDAESSLINRNINHASDQVSSILNSTDGILNDFLNVQVIATFNVPMDAIDPAVLRKKRALSVREFKKLSVEDSQRLIDSIGVVHKATEPMALADIYALADDNDDLFDVEAKKKMGFQIG